MILLYTKPERESSLSVRYTPKGILLNTFHAEWMGEMLAVGRNWES